MSAAKKTYRAKTGRKLTDVEIEALADDVERTDYDVDELKKRRRGRPMLGSAPAGVVPVRLDPDLRNALEERARSEAATVSEVVRRALREFLDVA